MDTLCIIGLGILILLLALLILAFYACYLADRIASACEEFNRDHL